MKAAIARNAYQQTEAQAKIHPVRLIQLMYERLLVHLEIAEEGVLQNDAKKRGENLSRAIALVAELTSSIKEDNDSEAAVFLRGLYSAILTELPKAVISNDVEIVRTATKYIQRLKDIWDETAVAEAGLTRKSHDDVQPDYSEHSAKPVKEMACGGGKKYGVAAAGGLALAGLSVSI
jgi:flagellar protein FliS